MCEEKKASLCRPHPTPPRRFRKSNVMAFPFNVMTFPVTGRSHGLAAAPGHGQVVLGAKKVARGPHSGPPQGRATSFVPSATWPWPGAAARPWERPVTGNAITLNGNAIKMKWKRRGGVRWGQLRVFVLPGQYSEVPVFQWSKDQIDSMKRGFASSIDGS